MELKARNVNDALNSALWYLKTAGVRETSRNGDVIVAPEPVLTTYSNPTERILWWPERDCNPFFHLFESLWMMAGRDDVNFVRYFNGKMGDYSDDGRTFNGAYGHRWRRRFGRDQLVDVVEHLKRSPDSRRAVLTMWGVNEDLAVVDSSKDVCCNTQAYFDLRGGVLNMTVCNRSNDAVWGAYGANAVHFSILQELIASALHVPVGVYRQFSNNLHMYTEKLYGTSRYEDPPTEPPHADRYVERAPTPMFDGTTLADIDEFCEAPDIDAPMDVFLQATAAPMYDVWSMRKGGAPLDEVLDALSEIDAWEWQLACTEWVMRREHAKQN